jgi:hypothetical protein
MIIIQAQYLIDAVPFAGTAGTHYYLKGPAIYACKEGGALIVATDGHRLGVFRDAEALVEGFPGTQDHVIVATVGNKALLAACKAARGDSSLKRWAVIDTVKNRVAVVLAGDAVDAGQVYTNEGSTLLSLTPAALIDGCFPDWRRVMPRMGYPDTIHAVPASYNPAYLGAFSKLGTKITVYSEDRENPSLVRVGDRGDFIGFLMPMRNNDGVVTVPSWVEE